MNTQHAQQVSTGPQGSTGGEAAHGQSPTVFVLGDVSKYQPPDPSEISKKKPTSEWLYFGVAVAVASAVAVYPLAGVVYAPNASVARDAAAIILVVLAILAVFVACLTVYLYHNVVIKWKDGFTDAIEETLTAARNEIGRLNSLISSFNTTKSMLDAEIERLRRSADETTRTHAEALREASQGVQEKIAAGVAKAMGLNVFFREEYLPRLEIIGYDAVLKVTPAIIQTAGAFFMAKNEADETRFWAGFIPSGTEYLFLSSIRIVVDIQRGKIKTAVLAPNKKNYINETEHDIGKDFKVGDIVMCLVVDSLKATREFQRLLGYTLEGDLVIEKTVVAQAAEPTSSRPQTAPHTPSAIASAQGATGPTKSAPPVVQDLGDLEIRADGGMQMGPSSKKPSGPHPAVH